MIGLTPKQAASKLDKSVKTLQRWRREKGVGPPFKVVKNRVYYPPREFMDWLEGAVRT